MHDDEFQLITSSDTVSTNRTWDRGDFCDFLTKNGSLVQDGENVWSHSMKERIKDWKPLYSTQGICTLCNQKSHECHTMKYGSLCMQAVANYHHHSNGNTLTFSGAKVFIDFYNTARSSWESWLDLSTSLLEGKMSWFCSAVVGMDEGWKIWAQRWSTR